MSGEDEEGFNGAYSEREDGVVYNSGRIIDEIIIFDFWERPEYGGGDELVT